MARGLAELQQRLAGEKGDAVRRVLSTPDGKVLLDALEDTFIEGDLLGKDHDETVFNLGGREVAQYLRRLVKLSRLVEQNNRTGR